MIQAILLIALGFLTASLIGTMVAPALWHRASRLSRKRLEQTLPITVSEIDAAQDQLKAAYAVRMRRLETALASAKQKTAAQVVDNSRLQMQIAALKDQITDLDLKLSERQNAAIVLEQTITRRLPELDREIAQLKRQLEERSYALQDLSNKLGRRNEELEEAERTTASYEQELTRLRQALEKNSADRGGRRLRGASKWNLEDYRAEYDRLNLELSKLRQQLAQLQERDAEQSGVIKGQLHKLTELILASAQPKGGPNAEPLPMVPRSRGLEKRRDRPVPWPESAPKPAPQAIPPAEPGGGSQTTQKLAGQSKASSEPALATAFESAPDRTAKPEAAGEVEGTPHVSRSRLLLEAVPEKALQQEGGASAKQGSGSPDTPAAPGGEKPVAEAAVNGSGPEPEQAGRQAAALLEKFREAGGEAV